MRKVSFSWKPTVSGREKWRWGLFMIVPSRSGRSNRLRILVRGLLLWLAGIAAALYLTAATAWFVMLERRPINYVTWIDCVLAPIRWDDISRMRGEAFIAEGLAALEDRRWSEARLKIEAGLARAPHHWTGRRSLGLFYVAAGRRDLGIGLMMEGLRLHYPGRDAVELLIQLGVLGDDFDTALDAVETASALPGRAVARDKDWLIDQKCRLLMVGERYEEALAWISDQEKMTDLRHESRTVALLELGRYDKARVALADWGEGSGVLGGVRRIGVRLERETGNYEAMREILDEMRRRAPASPQPWVYTVVQESLAGEEAAAAAALEMFFMRFGLKPQHLALAAEPLKDIEAWELYDEIISFAAERGIEGVQLQRLQVEAAMERGEFDLARTELSSYLAAQNTTPTAREQAWNEIMDALIEHLARGEDATGQTLVSIVESVPVELAFAKNMARQLEDAGRLETALRVWELSAHRYPASDDARDASERLRKVVVVDQPVEVELPDVEDGDAIDLDAVLPQPDELPDDIAVAIQSSRRFSGLVERLIEQKKWGELDQLLREVRRARPNWLPSAADAIYEAEIELNLGDENWSSLITNVRMRIDGSLDRALETMKIARRLDDLGERDMAERVLEEIERRQPNFPPARRMREDWAAEEEAASE